MGDSHSVTITFDAKFSANIVQLIVEKGFDLGFVYSADEEDQKKFGTDSYVLNVNQTSVKLLTVTEEIEDDGGPCLRVSFQDTGFLYFVKPIEKGMYITLFSPCPRWMKDFYYEKEYFYYEINFARYARLLLKVCQAFTILEVSTDIDQRDPIPFFDKEYLSAAICWGSYTEKYSIQRLFCNAVQNKFVFYDEKLEKQTEVFIDQLYNKLNLEQSVSLYACLDNIMFKIKIDLAKDGYDFISLYPLKPYKMKKGYGSKEEKVDLSFYVNRLLELCDNFVIYELRTL